MDERGRNVDERGQKMDERGRNVDERGRCALTCPRNGGIIAVEIKSERKC